VFEGVLASWIAHAPKRRFAVIVGFAMRKLCASATKSGSWEHLVRENVVVMGMLFVDMANVTVSQVTVNVMLDMLVLPVACKRKICSEYTVMALLSFVVW